MSEKQKSHLFALLYPCTDNFRRQLVRNDLLFVGKGPGRPVGDWPNARSKKWITGFLVFVCTSCCLCLGSLRLLSHRWWCLWNSVSVASPSSVLLRIWENGQVKRAAEQKKITKTDTKWLYSSQEEKEGRKERWGRLWEHRRCIAETAYARLKSPA